jgi:hypothetical protein
MNKCWTIMLAAGMMAGLSKIGGRIWIGDHVCTIPNR